MMPERLCFHYWRDLDRISRKGGLGLVLGPRKFFRMHIIVCMKQTREGEGPPAFPRRKGLEMPSESPSINLCDIYALEAAVTLKEKGLGVQITALTVGPHSSDQVLRYALARGANHAARIWHESLSIDDAFAVGMILARFTGLSDASLLFCGMMSEDSCSAMVPAFTAAKLKWPWMNRVIHVDGVESNSSIRAVQKGEKGDRLGVLCNLPAVLAFCPCVEGFQYVSVHRQLRTTNRPIQIGELDQLELEPTELAQISPITIVGTRYPKPRTKRTAIASQGLSGEDLMWSMISGSGGQKQDDNLVRGDPKKLADSILDYLLEEGLLDVSRLEPDYANGKKSR